MINTIDLKYPVCLDIETTGLDRFRDEITSIQIGFTNVDQGKYVRRFFDWKKLGMKRALMLLTKLKDAKLVTHNGKFDLLFLYVKTGIELKLWVDTLVMAHVCGEEELGLKPLVKKYFKVDYDISKEAKTGQITEKFKAYGLDDVYYPMELVKIFKKKLKIYSLEKVYKHEMRAYSAYLEVEKNGMPISPRRHKIAKKLQEQYKPILERLITVANINWNSTTQVAKVLFTEKGAPVYDEKGEKLPNTYQVLEYSFMNDITLRGEFSTRSEATQFMNEYKEENPHLYDIEVKLKHNYTPVVIGYGVGLKAIEKTAKGVPSVSSDVLANYFGNPVVDDLLEYRRLTKLETFIKSWEEIQVNDRIYPSFNITARTGRTTCSSPNIQQIPQDKNVRNLIEARPGWKIKEQDYSQIELRVASMFSGDTNMQHAYQSGSDLHSKTTELLFGDTSSLSPQEQKRKRTQSKACFSGDTEILTENGFIPFSKYDGVTPVAQVNRETLEMDFVKPLAFKCIPNQEVMEHNDRNVSIKCTLNHRYWLLREKVKSEIGEFKDIKLLGDSKLNWIKGAYLTNKPKLSVDETRFLCMCVSDGHFKENKTIPSAVTFLFRKKRKFDRCISIIKSLNLPHSTAYREDYGNYVVYVHSNEFVDSLFKYTTKDKKLIWDHIHDVDFDTYVNECLYWDGTYTKKKGANFVSIQEQTCDIMQYMFFTLGRKVNKVVQPDTREGRHTLYRLNIPMARGKSPFCRMLPSKMDISVKTIEDVYCVQVPKDTIVLRRNGKIVVLPNCNFGFLYGMSAKTFQEYGKGYGLSLTLEDCEHLRENFFNSYPTLVEWHKNCVEFAKANGYTWSPIGRKRFLPDINSSNFKLRGQAERQSINSGVQGFASDMCTSALADIVFSDEIDHDRCIVLGSVHDAILFEIRDDYVDEVSPIINRLMEKPSIIEGIDIPIPIVADSEVAQAWGG